MDLDGFLNPKTNFLFPSLLTKQNVSFMFKHHGHVRCQLSFSLPLVFHILLKTDFVSNLRYKMEQKIFWILVKIRVEDSILKY